MWYFDRLMSGYLFQPSELTLNKLLAKLSCPLLLLWGDLDPWMGASKADKIKLLYPQSSIVRLQAGHCPHDEAPELVNNALIEWISSSIELRGSWSITVWMLYKNPWLNVIYHYYEMRKIHDLLILELLSCYMRDHGIGYIYFFSKFVHFTQIFWYLVINWCVQF
mgnify:CR=1 FL=1